MAFQRGFDLLAVLGATSADPRQRSCSVRQCTDFDHERLAAAQSGQEVTTLARPKTEGIAADLGYGLMIT